MSHSQKLACRTYLSITNHSTEAIFYWLDIYSLTCYKQHDL